MREQRVSELLNGIYNIPKNYFNPPKKRILEERVINEVSSETPNPAELRNLERTAETLAKKYLGSSIKGLGLVALGIFATSLNYVDYPNLPEEEIQKYIKEYTQNGYIFFAGSLIASYGFIQVFSRMILSGKMQDNLTSIRSKLREMGYKS